MKVIDRLKLELNNKQYFTDEEYRVFLAENGFNEIFDIEAPYDKNTMQRKLLLTVLDVLEALSNDIDLMRKLDNPDIMSLGEAYKYLDLQKQNIKKRIAALPTDNETDSHISLFFTRG